MASPDAEIPEIPDIPGGIYVPVRQRYEGQGVIRWAVGSPTGPRSQTWNLIGERDGSVYIGPRQQMDEIKLSLHPAKWRMAFTEKAVAQRLGPEEDRVISRFEKPPEIRTGWRHAACVVIAMSNLGVGYPEKRAKPGTVGWFSALPLGHSLRFDVMIGEPGNVGFGIPLYSEVGGIDFADGRKVWVIATHTGLGDDYEKKMADLRLAASQGRDWAPDDRTWTWGESQEDRTPLIFDLSNLTPANPPRSIDVRSSEDRPGVRTLVIPAT
jgi:hypothetical protein